MQHKVHNSLEIREFSYSRFQPLILKFVPYPQAEAVAEVITEEKQNIPEAVTEVITEEEKNIPEAVVEVIGPVVDDAEVASVTTAFTKVKFLLKYHYSWYTMQELNVYT